MTYSDIFMYVCFIFFIIEAFRFIFNLQWGDRRKEYDGEFIINEDPSGDDIFRLEMADVDLYNKEEIILKVVKIAEKSDTK